ncbi:MAG: ammonia-forming cytochrome c nitrite reductase subunit c552 [Bacillota bacterium]|nr:ammonia-forming cytochrome c nitrite reductase subunit c552 [Bacillota bacterium]
MKKLTLICLLTSLLLIGVAGAVLAADAKYVGSATCGTCHQQQYVDWKATGHAKIIQDARVPGAILGNFEANTKFKAEDVAYTLGYGASQYYLRKDFSFLPGGWNSEAKKWSYSERPTPWNAGCAECHTVGYDKQSKSWADLGVGCESCHGPGAEHASTGDKTKIKVDLSNNGCEPCHGGERQVGQMATTGHPGIFLKALGTQENPNKENWDRYAKSNCIRCHSATWILAPADKKPDAERFKTGDLKNDRVGITCVVCHDPHKVTGFKAQLRKDEQTTCTQCHVSSSKIQLGSSPHHPQTEMLTGKNSDGSPIPGLNIPAVKKVVKCIDCHMPSGTHFFKAGTPTFTYKSKGKDVVADSCGSCHAGMTAEEIKEIQEKTEHRLETLLPRLAAAQKKLDELKAKGVDITALKALIDPVNTALHLAEAEKSKGIHNPWGSEYLLTTSEKNLAEFEAKTK